MDAIKILQSDILDLLFEGRNKDYGAYMLRKNYSKRLLASMGIMILICLVFSLAAFNKKTPKPQIAFTPVIDTVTLIDFDQEKAPPLPPEPPAPPAEPMEIATIKGTIPVIVTDEEVSPDEMPPTVDELELRKIAAFTRAGDDDIGLATPPPSDAIEKGIIDGPPQPGGDENKVYITVQIESQYPGGLNAWKRFLQRNMNYPEHAQINEIQGTVIVQFIVDTSGNVSQVVAISGPEELRAEAVRVISKSGKWTSAIQNGRKVKSYKRQPIVFRVES